MDSSAKKQTTTSSSSSFTNDLFGSKDSSASSSSGLFNSIFPPPSKDHRKEYISSQETEKNYGSTTGRGSTIDSVDNEERSHLKTDTSPYYQQATSQPCHLSSSIYYGGQDDYTNPRFTNNNTPSHSTQYTKDGEDDGRASRGNWWKGSLYY